MLVPRSLVQNGTVMDQRIDYIRHFLPQNRGSTNSYSSILEEISYRSEFGYLINLFQPEDSIQSRPATSSKTRPVRNLFTDIWPTLPKIGHINYFGAKALPTSTMKSAQKQGRSGATTLEIARRVETIAQQTIINMSETPRQAEVAAQQTGDTRPNVFFTPQPTKGL